MAEGRDYRTLRFNSDVGKHGDTGTSEVEVVRAVLDGRADAGAIGSPFWNAVRSRAPGAGRRADVRSGPRRPTIIACSRRGPISTRRWSAVRRRAVRDELRQPDAIVLCSTPKGCAWWRRSSMAMPSCGRRRRNRAS